MSLPEKRARNKSPLLRMYAVDPPAIVSIVPLGFHATAHKVFHNYSPPTILSAGRRNQSTVHCIDHRKRRGDCSSPCMCGERECIIARVIGYPCFGIPDSLGLSSHDECAICLSAFIFPVMLIECKHSFCSDCIIKWCSKNNICPLCKSTKTDFIEYWNGKYHVRKFQEPIPGHCDDNVIFDSERLQRRAIKSAIRHYKQCFMRPKTVDPTITNENSSTLSRKKKSQETLIILAETAVT